MEVLTTIRKKILTIYVFRPKTNQKTAEKINTLLFRADHRENHIT